jgi:hypothetical protein
VSSYVLLRNRRGIQDELSKGFSRPSSFRKRSAGELFTADPYSHLRLCASSVAGGDGGSVLAWLGGVMSRAEFVTGRTSCSWCSSSDMLAGHMKGDDSAMLLWWKEDVANRSLFGLGTDPSALIPLRRQPVSENRV